MIGRKDLLLPLAIAGLLLAGLHGLDLDTSLSRLFFDPLSQRFPLEHQPILEKTLHANVKHVVRGMVTLVGMAALLSLLSARLRVYSRPLFFILVASLLSAGLVSSIKQGSYQSCPERLTTFGGDRPHFGLLDPIPPGTPKGQCWPGGHAASAFSLFPFYLAMRHLGHRRLALGVLGFVLAFGMLLSWVQVARGMHLMSHHVWTALFCWYASLAIYWLFFFRGWTPSARTIRIAARRTPEPSKPVLGLALSRDAGSNRPPGPQA